MKVVIRVVVLAIDDAVFVLRDGGGYLFTALHVHENAAYAFSTKVKANGLHNGRTLSSP